MGVLALCGIGIYAYAMHSPLSNIDPLGLWVLYIGGTGNIIGGPLSAMSSGGFVIDSGGRIGVYRSRGIGTGVGDEASFGLSLGFFGSTRSNDTTTTICDFAGPFEAMGIGLGLGPHGSFDIFRDPSKPYRGGGGVTIGAGAGGGLTTQFTDTEIYLLTLSSLGL